MARVASLFTGIGGFDLGFERAGFEIVYQCELDKHCRAKLAEHFPGVPTGEDIRDVRGRDLPVFDVLVGGFPCQDRGPAGHPSVQTARQRRCAERGRAHSPHLGGSPMNHEELNRAPAEAEARARALLQALKEAKDA